MEVHTNDYIQQKIDGLEITSKCKNICCKLILILNGEM